MSAENEVEWLGVLVPRSAYNRGLVEARDRLADAAKAGDWHAVLGMLDDGGKSGLGANDWRVSGTSWFGPLHQAAWLGAPEAVVRGLVERGAWLSLRDSSGRRPVDIARERDHLDLVDVLTPTYDVPISEESAAAMARRLADLVQEAVRQAIEGSVEVRHLDVLCLAERGDKVWFPIPGMYGGFAAELFRGRLHADSWSRVVGGSGRAYAITAERTTLIDDGFV